MTRKRNLAGHGHVAADGAPNELGEERTDNGDPGGRSVLRGGSVRKVHVQVGLLVEGLIDLTAVGVRTQPGPRASADSVACPPELPVRVSAPLPLILRASTGNKSPPAAFVQSPMANPGRLARSATSLSNRFAPRACGRRTPE